MINDNIPDQIRVLRWARRQPDLTKRFAAMTAYCALNCIAAGWQNASTMDALADNVAKMKGEA